MNAFPPGVLAIWAVLALAALVGIVLGYRQEGRWFAARNKRGPWLVLRICTIPIAVVTAGLVLLVTRSVGGPEALAAFFLSLITLAPLVYFGMHWLIGRWQNPALSFGESAWIAFSGLLAVIGPAVIASVANSRVHDVARAISGT